MAECFLLNPPPIPDLAGMAMQVTSMQEAHILPLAVMLMARRFPLMSHFLHPLDHASYKALAELRVDANPAYSYSLQLVQWALENRPTEIPIPAQVADFLYIVLENSYMMLDWHPAAIQTALDNEECSLASMNLESDELAIRMAENLYWYLEKRVPVLRLTETSWD
jgi:hypothetical protein